MELNEFLERNQVVDEEPEELDVQRAVVEELAADKAEQGERIKQLQKENYALKSKISTLQESIAELKAQMAKIGDNIAANVESTLANQVALLDRDIEVPDQFEGETRDQVLEVIKAAQIQAEKDGRARCALLLESVLKSNEPTGELAKRRQALEKVFAENGNILSGPVLEELKARGILYKKGEEYLLPSEIIKLIY